MSSLWPGPLSSAPSSSGSSSESLRKKRRFFRALQAPFNLSPEDDDPDDRELERRRRVRCFFPRPKKGDEHQAATHSDSNSRPQHHAAQEPAPHPPRPSTGGTPGRALSAPTGSFTNSPAEIIKGTPLHGFNPRQSTTSADITDDSFIEETPPPAAASGVGGVPATASAAKIVLGRHNTAPLPATVSAAAPRTRSVSANSPSMATSDLGRKRKRTMAGGGEGRVPEERRIFRGLAFYYIPDSDVAPARRIRMAKAEQYGARRVRSPAEATHVIVDKGLEYKDVAPLVGSLLAPGAADAPAVVRETFPGDCIEFRVLLNPLQDRYLVRGCPRATTRPASTRVEPSQSPLGSQDSLQLRPATLHKRSRSTNQPSSTPPGREKETERLTGSLVTASEEIVIPSSQEIPEDEDGTPGLHTGNVQETTKGSREAGLKDELGTYIELVAQYKDLPLEDRDDDASSVGGSELSVSDGEQDDHNKGSNDEGSRRTRSGEGASKTRSKAARWEDAFACSHGGTKSDKKAEAEKNPNARTIEILQSMCDFYDRTNDHWRTTAYRRAIKTLQRTTDRRITTAEQAARLPGVGSRLAQKIAEIAAMNRLRRLAHARVDPLDAVLQTFMGVYGAGLARARKWIAQGHRTLEDLAARARLTPAQRMGVDRYADLNSRIPRAEVEALGRLVRREAALVDPGVEVLIAGSYRRGADSSGDVDLVFTKKGTVGTDEMLPFLEELLARLTRAGVVVATVAALRTDRPGGSKWHGCCVLLRGPGTEEDDEAAAAGSRQVWRRVDFLLVPETEYGAALIYFTGNEIFNRSMRLLASKKGMRLNQRGLYRDVMRGLGRSKVTAGELVEGRDERRIFEILGVKWREPWERWC